MKEKTKLVLGGVAVMAGLVGLLVGDSISTGNRHRAERQFSQEVQRIQEDLTSVETYLNHRKSPEDFDGWYSLGWMGPRVPARYEPFVKSYE